jgi:apolipoprotein N-acyltransferase
MNSPLTTTPVFIQDLKKTISVLTLAFIAGALTVFGFAPFHVYVIPFFSLAILFQLWRHAPTMRLAFLTGWYFGFGFFLLGVSWIYVSLHTFGSMPAPLAGLATVLFCAFLALFPAVAGFLVAWRRPSPIILFTLTAPALWTVLEWMRSWVFTGFPWLSLGYSQVSESPLAGLAPVGGVFLVSLLLCLSAGLLALAWEKKSQAIYPLALLMGLLFISWNLKSIQWTQPTGTVTTVSLLQGNRLQDEKWRPENLITTLKLYRDMVLQSHSQLIVMPETALPVFLHQLPPGYIEQLAEHAQHQQGAVLVGTVEQTGAGVYFNSLVALGASSRPAYRKTHLVPFGEYIPLRPLWGWIVGLLAIPLQDMSRGASNAQPLFIAGQWVALNICYEDAFGDEIRRQLPLATVLINASNVAWFGHSIAPQQHLQISQMRALETGRFMLRATNTGLTAIINNQGQVVSAAPEFTTTRLTGSIPGFKGVTPFVRWGDQLPILLSIFLWLSGFLLHRYAHRPTSPL